MNRIDIINFFISKHNYQTYLEIGCNHNVCFNAVEIKNKTGVDPVLGGTHRMSSNDFFQENKRTFDIVFIDGLHTSQQVAKDIENALNCLNENGTIICHDMNPEKEEIQREYIVTDEWCGDVWKTWVSLRKTRQDLEMYVVDADYGLGIIRKGNQTLLVSNLAFDYNNLASNRSEWLNLISIKEFTTLYK